MRIYDRVICFANCHFAAHLEAVSKRNADFDHIYQTMSFTRPSQGLQSPSGGASSAVPLNRGGTATGSQSDDGKPDLSEADMVHPAAGIIKPGQIIELAVNHEEYFTRESFLDGIPTNRWCEDTRDKEVLLIVSVTGSYSTEKKIHRIHVRRCYSSQSSTKEEKGTASNRVPSNHLHRADFAEFESISTDLVQDLCPIRGH